MAHNLWVDRNQKIFIITLAVYILGEFTAISLTNLYLWEITKNFQSVLFYNAFVFAAIAVSGILSSVIGKRFGSKFIFTISMLFYAIQLLFLSFGSKITLQYLIPIGIISGFAVGSLSYSYNIISQLITKNRGREKFLGTKSSILNSIILFGVPGLTFITLYFGSYTPIFILGIFFVLSACFIATKISLFEEKASFRLYSVQRVFKQFPDLKSFILAKYLFGIQSGLFWVVLGIITLQFVGDIFRWGIFSSALTLISIITAYLYGKNFDLRSEKYPAVIVAFLFASVTILLAIHWNFFTFIIYQLVLVALTVIMSVSFDAFMAAIIEEDSQTENLRHELNGIGEFILNLGRLTPIFLLLFLEIPLENNFYVRVSFLLVAPLFLFIMGTIKKTPAFG